MNGRKILIMELMLLLFFFIGITVEASSNKEEEWSSLEIKKELSLGTYRIYSLFFHQDHFELMGKLMTLFLKDKGKGYQLTRVGENRFLIRSRSSIQEGSVIIVDEITDKGFVFNGDLIIKKGISFTCQFQVVSNFSFGNEPGEIYSYSCINYRAPELAKGINASYKFLTGQDLVGKKISDFLENLYFVLEKINELDIGEWRSLSQNQEYLQELVFPVEFSQEEISLIAEVLVSREG